MGKVRKNSRTKDHAWVLKVEEVNVDELIQNKAPDEEVRMDGLFLSIGDKTYFIGKQKGGRA